MEVMESTFYEEDLFNSMLESSENMVEVLTNLNEFLDRIVVMNGPILPFLRSLKNNPLKERILKYYDSSILLIQNTARFYTSFSSFYNENIFKLSDLSLKDLKVERIVDIGISLEKMVESYHQLSDNSLLKKNLAPMIEDVLKVSGKLEKLITLLRPILQNGKTIAESIELLKDENYKENALKYCDLCNQKVKSLVNRYPYFDDIPFYESCKNISMKEPEKITFNTLNQWKSTLISHQEGLKLKKFEVLLPKKEATKKIFLNDVKEIYSMYHELDLKDLKDVTGKDIRNYLNQTQKLFVWFEKRYKVFQTDYFDSKSYIYVLNFLENMKSYLNTILDFPLMTFVSSQSIFKYYKKTTLKQVEKEKIVSLLRTLKGLNQAFCFNLKGCLEENNISVNSKKKRFKKKIHNKKRKENFSEWLFNKESGFDEKECGTTKLVRDHIHEYKETNRKKVDCHNCFTKIFISKTCATCGKVENFEEIQLNDHFLEFVKRKILKKIDLNIVNLKKLLPRIEARDQYIKMVLEELKRYREKCDWYEEENIYMDEPKFRAFIESSNENNSLIESLNEANTNQKYKFISHDDLDLYSLEYTIPNLEFVENENLGFRR